MTIFQVFLLAAALSLPVHKDGETPQHREARIAELTTQQANAAQRAIDEGLWKGSIQELGILLLVQAYWESGLVERIGLGKCRKEECDPNKRGFHRARGYYQLHNTPMLKPGEWKSAAGPSSEYNASWAAARVLSEARKRCGWRKGAEVEGTIAWYARGKCYWKGAKPRAAMYRRLIGQYKVQ